MRTKTAWDLIGYEGDVRIKGGRAVYESVEYNDATPGTHVRLARLVQVRQPARYGYTGGWRLKQINRYVDPDTELEVL